MKKIMLLLLAGAVCANCFGQRKLKYKDIYEQLGIEKPADYAAIKKDQEERRARQLEALRGVSTSPENRARSFFADAPGGYGALDW